MKSQINTNRMYVLDWLRIFGISVVFLYHSTRFFNIGDWHIKNSTTYVWVEIVNVFAGLWMMPLFFVISGASIFFAIEKSKGFGNFYRSKFLRLLIPVILASVTHGAFQVYLEKLTHGSVEGSFFSFLPELFNGVYMDIGMSGNFPFHGMHLWYLLFLFMYSLLFYPLFMWFKKSGQKVTAMFSKLLSTPGVMYPGVVIPFIAMYALIPLNVLSPGAGGWGFMYYIWFFIAGFMIVADTRLLDSIKNQRWLSLVLGVSISVVYLYQLFSNSPVTFSGWMSMWVKPVLRFSGACCWLLAILGFGMHHFSSNRPSLEYLNETVLPFYILHQTILLIFGYFIMSWNIHDLAKWAIVSILSFTVIILIYEIVIRKNNIVRFLFGMKTSGSLYALFKKRIVFIILNLIYIGMVVFAITQGESNRSPMPLTFEPEHDIILNYETISHQSSDGVRIVNDNETSKGTAIEFFSGAHERPVSKPNVFVEMQFTASAGQYIIWSRGKSDVNSGYTDSYWMQIDDQIGTREALRLGNWLDVHPAGVYGWASDINNPVAIELNYTGEHRILLQPRQTTHRIDQIWLSKAQLRIPDTKDAIQ